MSRANVLSGPHSKPGGTCTKAPGELKAAIYTGKHPRDAPRSPGSEARGRSQPAHPRQQAATTVERGRVSHGTVQSHARAACRGTLTRKSMASMQMRRATCESRTIFTFSCCNRSLHAVPVRGPPLTATYTQPSASTVRRCACAARGPRTTPARPRPRHHATCAPIDQGTTPAPPKHRWRQTHRQRGRVGSQGGV